MTLRKAFIEMLAKLYMSIIYIENKKKWPGFKKNKCVVVFVCVMIFVLCVFILIFIFYKKKRNRNMNVSNNNDTKKKLVVNPVKVIDVEKSSEHYEPVPYDTSSNFQSQETYSSISTNSNIASSSTNNNRTKKKKLKTFHPTRSHLTVVESNDEVRRK